MKLKFIPPPQEAPIYIANVHRTGKIGFTIAAAKHFNINTSRSMQFAINEGDTSDPDIYGVLVNGVDETVAYKIMKGGDYHSVNAKAFFDAIKMDYSTHPISFVVTDFEVDGTKMLRFTKREYKKAVNGQQIKNQP